MNPTLLLDYLLNDCGLFAFPIHSIEAGTSSCTCSKGAQCTAPGKHPYLNLKWKNIATNSIKKLNSWANKKQINYAVCTGRLSERTQKYLVVVDIDTQEHELMKSLPETFRYKTGSGGYHYWYWSEVPVKNSVSQVADKVDIRGTGGYVIIPPSKHVSGKNYTLLCDETQEIADLPSSILETLASRELQKNIEVQKPKKTKGFLRTPDLKLPIEVGDYNWWSASSVKTLRDSLEAGKKIPLGVRNIVVHRLLSSDRARGLAMYDDLISKVATYRSSMESPETFEDRELRNVVCSVMRYPIYNNNVENVNKNYAKWMAKHKSKDINPDTLESLDTEFFSTLEKNNSKGIPLNFLAQVRKEWYHAKGLKDGFATYRPQLLAKKLKQLGFIRTRSASQNLWNVNINSLEYTEEKNMSNTNSKSIVLGMSDAVESPPEAETYEIPEEEAEASMTKNGPIGPDGEPLTLIEERDELIETKAKYHPNERKYSGHSGNSQEQMMELIKFFGELNPQQQEDYSNGVLIFDEERTRGWIGALEVGDIIGIKNCSYKVDAIYPDEISCCPAQMKPYERKRSFDTVPEMFSIYDVDLALNISQGEILYRNEKPFGVEQDLSYKVKVSVYADKVGRTYVFRSGRKVISSNEGETTNVK